MKYLFSFTFLILISIGSISAQELPLPLLKENSKGKKVKTTFKELSEQYENYFADKDINKKGSGYKPFKRWEYHWSHYLQADGTIAPAETLWQAWEQKQKMTNSAKVVSNWIPRGPFSNSSKNGHGRINTVMVDPNNANIIYVGAPSGGLWKSIDTGVNWTPLTDHLPQIGVSSIAINPNNSNIIYISTGDDDGGDSYSIGVLKSTNGGTTWNTTGDLGDISGIVRISYSAPTSNEIIIDPTNSNIIWVATGAGLFQSTNAGTSWVNKLSGDIKDFKLKPGDSNIIYAVSRSQFYVSTDGGTTFDLTSTGLPEPKQYGRLCVEVTPAAPNFVYVLSAGWPDSLSGRIYKSSDNGASFTKTNQNDIAFISTQYWYDLALSVSDSDPNIILVGAILTWKSTDGGNDFVRLDQRSNNNQTFLHPDVHFLRYYNGILYTGNDGGVYKSTDDGTNFIDLTENLSISQFYRIAVSKQTSNKLAGGLQDMGGFALSNNIWDNFYWGDGTDMASDPNDENIFYGFNQYGRQLFVTNDGGYTTTYLTAGPNYARWVPPLIINKGSNIYAGFDQLYKLENRSWVQISDHAFSGNIETLEIDPSSNKNIYVSSGLNLYKSSDNGETFTTFLSSETGISGINISSIEVHNSDSNIVWVTTTGVDYWGIISSRFTGGGVYKSINGGLTFTDISNGLPNETKFVVRHHMGSPNNSIYVGTALGVYYRDDITNTWETFDTNLPNVAVPDLEINPYDATITVATYGRSVWQSSIPIFAFTDLDLTKISSPDNSDVACGAILPPIRVLNNGLNTINSFSVNYNVDNGTNQVFNWTGSLSSNASTIVNLPGVSSLTEGRHSMNVAITAPSDINQFNNSMTTSFSVNQSGAGQFINIFEDINTDQWIASDLWQIGTPTTEAFNNVVASGYVTNPSGNYTDATVAFLYSPCYNLALLENPVLKFKMVFDMELYGDVMYLEYSLDGATWQVLGTALDPNWYNSGSINSGYNYLLIGKQWTGTNTTLKEYSYNLAALTNESSIIFRFKFASNQTLNKEGIVIDDFQIDATAILSINEFDNSAFIIYPNPVTNILSIDSEIPLIKVEIYSILGKKVKEINSDFNSIKTSDLSKGLYIVRMHSENGTTVIKLIKQ